MTRRTLNEVYRLCRAAAEGAGAPAGLDEAAAAGAVWLLTRDLPALADLADGLKRLDSAACRFDGAVDSRLNAAGKAGALIAPALVDYLVADASDHGQCGRLVVECLSAPLFLLPRADYYARRGYGFQFRLSDRSGIRCLLCLSAEHGLTILGSAKNVAITDLIEADGFDVEALCATAVDALPAVGRSAFSVLIEDESCAAAQARHRARGVEVSTGLWQRLRNFAQRVLVPATEASRLRGAGARISDNH